MSSTVCMIPAAILPTPRLCRGKGSGMAFRPTMMPTKASDLEPLRLAGKDSLDDRSRPHEYQVANMTNYFFLSVLQLFCCAFLSSFCS